MTIIIFRSIEEIHPLRLEMKEKVFSIFFPRHDQKSKEPYFQFRAPRQQQPSSNDFRRLSMRHSTMIEAQPGTLIILFFFVSSFWQMMLLECYTLDIYTYVNKRRKGPGRGAMGSFAPVSCWARGNLLIATDLFLTRGLEPENWDSFFGKPDAFLLPGQLIFVIPHLSVYYFVYFFSRLW